MQPNQDVATAEEINRANEQLGFANNNQIDTGTASEVEAANASLGFPSSFNVDVKQTVPSSALSDGVTADDVFAARSRMEADQKQQVSLEGITGETGQPTVFDDPEKYILDVLYGEQEQTDTQREAAGIRSDITETTEGISSGLAKAERRAEETTNISGLQAGLAETNEKIARRQARFRRELRAFETDAERRGVARDFYQGELNKLEADATAELADLYIIQNAQSGNVEAARDYITTAVENKYRSIEAELAAQQARLNEVIPRLEKEEKDKALKLQLALTERQANIEEEKATEEAKRELLATAAANGADSVTQRQILNSASLDDAMLVAGPWIGRLERLKAQASMSNTYLNNRAKLMELALAGDPDALSKLGSFGEELIAKRDALKSVEEQQAFEANVAAGSALQQRINRYSVQLGNDLGIKTSTGSLQSPLVTGGLAGPFGGTSRGNAADLAGFVPVIGNVMNYSRANNAKNDFLGTVTEMVNIAGFDNLLAYKAGGATFGALSDSEFVAIKSASGPLAALAEYENGRVVGFRGSESEVRQAYQIALDQLNTQMDDLNKSLLDDETNAEIINRTK